MSEHKYTKGNQLCLRPTLRNVGLAVIPVVNPITREVEAEHFYEPIRNEDGDIKKWEYLHTKHYRVNGKIIGSDEEE